MKQLFSFFPAYSAKALLFAFALLFSMNEAYGSDGIAMHRDFTTSNASDAVKQTIDWVQIGRAHV